MQRSTFLKRLVSVGIFGKFSQQSLQQSNKIYLQQFFVAGFRYYKGMQLLTKIAVSDFLELRREPNNPYDDCAIALYWQHEKIGFVPASNNEVISRLIDANALPLLAQITHINKLVQPWENLAVAIYFLQPAINDLPNHANYLKTLLQPKYTTYAKKNNQKKK